DGGRSGQSRAGEESVRPPYQQGVGRGGQVLYSLAAGNGRGLDPQEHGRGRESGLGGIRLQAHSSRGTQNLRFRQPEPIREQDLGDDYAGGPAVGTTRPGSGNPGFSAAARLVPDLP